MNTLECPKCNGSITASDKKCKECGFPVKGTEKEKAIFIGRKYAKKHEEEDAKKTLNRLRIFLFSYAALHFLLIFVFMKRFATTQLSIAFFEGATYLAFGFLCKKHPVGILTIATCFYIFCKFFFPVFVFPFFVHLIILIPFAIGIYKANSLDYKFIDR